MPVDDVRIVMVVLKVMSVLTTNLALLHAGGWDELLMVGAGLAIAWLIITWTGRSRDDSEEEDEEDEPGHDQALGSSETRDEKSETLRRPNERRDDE